VKDISPRTDGTPLLPSFLPPLSSGLTTCEGVRLFTLLYVPIGVVVFAMSLLLTVVAWTRANLDYLLLSSFDRFAISHSKLSPQVPTLSLCLSRSLSLSLPLSHPSSLLGIQNCDHEASLVSPSPCLMLSSWCGCDVFLAQRVDIFRWRVMESADLLCMLILLVLHPTSTHDSL
jgi:hypothetical protein